MCVAELVLRGRRSAPDDGGTIRTRRGRASLAGLGANGPSSQSSQGGTSVNGSTKMLGRKTSQSHKPAALAKSRLRDSDEESDAVPLRESNLMSHTSMSSLRQAGADSSAPVRSGRPPLIPPSQQAGGRSALVPPEAAPTRPIKRTRFENVEASSSDSTKVPSAEASASQSQNTQQPASTSGRGSVGLVQILSDQAAKILAILGYHTVGDLSGIGVSREDWPDLNAFLASCTVEQFESFARNNTGSLDPLQKFLSHRRARIAFIDEANGSYLALRE
ncbi:hypothetical protein P389DRAFT_168711 [Cystobasidium minutum MCA 4210]|uniref:uncharacterized protein n=1 Tax=Cystobasidium minutum MCA 4210 TaxID=1397322 RepID=UPI0034CE21EE|eukprot:jgi/Rhomi1/168711/fgenesh1_kg.3_\